MSVETMARLYELKNIVGVKDATANIARVSLQRQAMGPDFIQLSGEDATALGFMAHGGHGCISVTSNVAPRLCAELQERLPGGRLCRGADAAGPADAAAHGALHRDEPVADEVCAVGARPHGRRGRACRWCRCREPTEAAVRAAMVHAGLINA